jgi:hypothetical protein
VAKAPQFTSVPFAVANLQGEVRLLDRIHGTERFNLHRLLLDV